MDTVSEQYLRNPHFILCIIFSIILSYDLNHVVAYADDSNQPDRQIIGNYESLFMTHPISPVVGNETQITMLVRSVSGEILQNTSGIIRLMEPNSSTIEEKRITIPSTEYNYNYTFVKPGDYIMILDIYDQKSSESMSEFRFEINVSEKNSVVFPYYDYIFFGLGLIIWFILVYLLLIKRKKKNNTISKP